MVLTTIAARFCLNRFYESETLPKSSLMTVLLVIATSDFSTSAGKHFAGQTVATIETDMTSGELASLLRMRSNVTVESTEDADEQDPDHPDAGDANTSGDDPGDDDDDQSGADDLVINMETTLAAMQEADLLEKKPVELLAANDPAITTVGDLAAWIALGNRPSKITGIGGVTEKELLEATGLSLN